VKLAQLSVKNDTQAVGQNGSKGSAEDERLLRKFWKSEEKFSFGQT